VTVATTGLPNNVHQGEGMSQQTQYARIMMLVGAALYAEETDLTDGAITEINQWLTEENHEFSRFATEGDKPNRLAVIANRQWRREGYFAFSQLLNKFCDLVIDRAHADRSGDLTTGLGHKIANSAIVKDAIASVSSDSGTFLCNPPPDPKDP
jgi:hypothetical protein